MDGPFFFQEEMEMSIYTKHGDKGITSLINEAIVSKADDRIELLGIIDELSSYIGFAKVMLEEPTKNKLSEIQKDLIIIMSGVADAANPDYFISEKKIKNMEEEIDYIENSFSRKKEFILYGDCELSSRLDLARAITRKTERYFVKVSLNRKIDLNAIKYINRLSDYFYILARYVDYKNTLKKNKKLVDN